MPSGSSSDRLGRSSKAAQKRPPPPPTRPCPVNKASKPAPASPYYRVNLSTSGSEFYDSDASSFTSEASRPETPELQSLRRRAERAKARVTNKAKEKKDHWEKKFPEAVPKAKGDLGALDEEEEDDLRAEEEWENYKNKGGRKTRAQFFEDLRVMACEDYLRSELKIKPNMSEFQLAGAQWTFLLKDALRAALIHLKRETISRLGLAIKN